MSHEPPILVIADDLSGAAELAGIAFARGLSAEVQRKFEPVSAARVIVVDTDSRALPPEAAAERIAVLARQASASGAAWIYKKVDSLLRGNVRAEIEALLAATGLNRSLLMPANPSRRRIIAGGSYSIDGVPLNRSPLAADPDHPRLAADVRTLLGEEGQFALHAALGADALPATGIVVPNAVTTDDLGLLARHVDRRTLPAGAADFFQALLDERLSPDTTHDPQALLAVPPIARPVLVACGSKASWPARRAEALEAGMPIFALDRPEPIDAELAIERLRSIGCLLAGIDGDLPTGERRRAALDRLVPTIAALIERAPAATLLIEGGATASIIAAALGWSRFEVAAEVPAGVGALRPIDGSLARPLVLIKPGSYPWPRPIWLSVSEEIA